MASQLVAALGSSFAAGPGIDPVADVNALRSARNYPHVLADLMGADLVDLTVSGATTDTILDTPQVTPTGATFAPQLEGVPESADVVTVTAGGNDVDFLGSVLRIALERAAPDSPLLPFVADPLGGPVAAPTPERLAAATDGLEQVVRRARAAAPRARVVLVDYLTVLGPDAVAPFTPDDVAVLRRIQSAVATAFEDAAARTGADLVRASELSRDHHVGAAEPWIQPLHLDPTAFAGSFHPTAAGMAAVAHALHRLLGR